MPNHTAAAYAAILDPERTIEDWWTPCWTSPDFGGTPVENLPTVCKFNDWYFTGPPDLHTAREHSWRGEDWLEARGIGWIRHMTETLPAMTCVMVGHGTENPSKVCNPNHAAAIAEAVRRVNNGQ
jgi:hypothetical protein